MIQVLCMPKQPQISLPVSSCKLFPLFDSNTSVVRQLGDSGQNVNSAWTLPSVFVSHRLVATIFI